MDPNVETALRNLQSSGWRCERNDSGFEMPSLITNRYPWIPEEVASALRSLRSAVSPDENLWLLTVFDYSGSGESAFAWNEWEKLTIESAEGDQEWIDRITAFWNDNFPIALSVGDGYAYFALTRDGSVVTGREPEFEEPSPYAPGFVEFLNHLARRD